VYRLFSKLISLGLIIFFFYGCVANQSIKELSPENRARVSNIKFLSSEGLPENSYKILGAVETSTCKRFFNEGSDRTQMKIQKTIT